ncbi:MAG: DUF2141 domain-containing protein, partial [Caldithrix sp.]|nr:DUF2141 domain-containing protein [Caldithrix sp.]
MTITSRYVILMLFGLYSIAAGQNENQKGDISITVQKLRTGQGSVRALLFNTDKGFPQEYDKALQKVTVTAQNDSVTIRFNDIDYGSYAVSLIHDENENMKLDSNWLGIPK